MLGAKAEQERITYTEGHREGTEEIRRRGIQ